VLLSHLQELERELQLVDGGLVDVDLIVGGGGDERLADPGHRLLAGDTPGRACAKARPCYPIVRQAKDGRPVLVVATDGQHRYVGNLLVSFDGDGVLTGFDAGSRPWPVDDVSLQELSAATVPAAVALEADVRRVVEPLSKPIVLSRVYLEGRREAVRYRETNLGDLSADAMVWAARKSDPRVQFALRNGGGIRNPIGRVDDVSLQVEGGPITPLDVKNALRFDNRLVSVTTSRRTLVETLEAALRGGGAGGGHFPQVSSELRIVYDPARPAQEVTVSLQGTVTAVAKPGQRIRELTVGSGKSAVRIVADGKILDPEAQITFVTLDYLARGGDGWFPGTAAKLQPKLLDTSEVASFTAFLEDLEARGAWKEGAGWPDPDPAAPDTFGRIRAAPTAAQGAR
jgi:5'-nucleotidase